MLHKHAVPPRFSVLSVDVDMYDFWILLAILKHPSHYRPAVIIVETNPTLCMNTNNYLRDYMATNAIPMTVTHPSLNPNQTMWDLTRYSQP